MTQTPPALAAWSFNFNLPIMRCLILARLQPGATVDGLSAYPFLEIVETVTEI